MDRLGCRLRRLASDGEPSLLDSVLDSTPRENTSANVINSSFIYFFCFFFSRYFEPNFIKILKSSKWSIEKVPSLFYIIYTLFIFYISNLKIIFKGKKIVLLKNNFYENKFALLVKLTFRKGNFYLKIIFYLSRENSLVNLIFYSIVGDNYSFKYRN